MTRVVLVEDHDMVAEAIGLALERAGIEVVARASTIAAALAETREGRPDESSSTADCPTATAPR